MVQRRGGADLGVSLGRTVWLGHGKQAKATQAPAAGQPDSGPKQGRDMGSEHTYV